MCNSTYYEKEGESFKGQEYLGLYPFIDYETRKGTQEYEFWVNDPENGNYISLRKWLSGENHTIIMYRGDKHG